MDNYTLEESTFLKELISPRSSEQIIYFLGYLGATLSFTFFTLNSAHLLPLLTPISAQETTQKAWKWRNTVNSAIHSFITGFGSVINLWLTPELRTNLISVHTISSVIINSISVGYFIYDFIDLCLNNFGKKNTTELLLHHVLVTLCFGLSLISCLYQGYAMVALLMEVNSIFLHLRQLCILHSIPVSSRLYTSICYSNIATFLVFRIAPLCWQIHWLTVHKNEVPTSVVYLGFVTSAIIMVISLGLLVQIINKDFRKKRIVETTKSD